MYFRYSQQNKADKAYKSSNDEKFWKEQCQLNHTYGFAISVISKRGSRPFPMPSKTVAKVTLPYLRLLLNKSGNSVNPPSFT